MCLTIIGSRDREVNCRLNFGYAPRSYVESQIKLELFRRFATTFFGTNNADSEMALGLSHEKVVEMQVKMKKTAP